MLSEVWNEDWRHISTCHDIVVRHGIVVLSPGQDSSEKGRTVHHWCCKEGWSRCSCASNVSRSRNWGNVSQENVWSIWIDVLRSMVYEDNKSYCDVVHRSAFWSGPNMFPRIECPFPLSYVCLMRLDPSTIALSSGRGIVMTLCTAANLVTWEVWHRRIR